MLTVAFVYFSKILEGLWCNSLSSAIKTGQLSGPPCVVDTRQMAVRLEGRKVPSLSPGQGSFVNKNV